MNSFKCSIHLEPLEAEKLLYVLNNLKCINPNPLTCDFCYHYPACKFITEFSKNLEHYLEELEGERKEE